MRAIVTAALGGLLLSVFAGHAEAGLLVKGPPGPRELSFIKCDGYELPSKRADGLTTGTWLFGLASATTDQRRQKMVLGAGGTEACDSALADPAVVPAFAMRRAHLLQSKAMHQIASGKLTDALATLEQSDAAGRAEPLFNDSLGEGNRALRATALMGLGRKDEAEAALSELERLRPYSASLQLLAASVRLQFEDEREKQAAILERQARLNPYSWHRLFWSAMMYDEYRSAVRYAPLVRFDIPRNRGAWVVEGADSLRYQIIGERAQFAGALAFAQMASGDKAAAATTVRGISLAIADWMAPPPPPRDGEQWSRREKEDWERRKMTGARADKQVKAWAGAMTLLQDAKGKPFAEVEKMIDERKPPILAYTSILAAVATPQPADLAKLRSILDGFKEGKDAARLKETKISFEQLVKLLPRPETPAMRPVMQSEGGNLLRSDLNGYGVRNNDEPGSLTVRFGTATGSVAMADEAVLLAAAQRALKDGKDSLLIDTRQSIQRTTRMVGMYSAGAEFPSGYEVRLSLRPVASASVTGPERVKLILASEVVASLAPKYPPPGTAR
jgi:hypothetical protein